MALQLQDRVLETANSPGTGTVTLLGASLGYQSFNTALTSGNTTYYTIADLGGANWEVGIGTFTSPNQLTRDTVLSSSNAGSTVNFSSGTQNVFITYPAEKSINVDAGTAVTFPGNINMTTGTFATNSRPIVGGSYDGNQLQLTNGGGSELNSLRDGFVKLQTGTSGTALTALVFTSAGALGFGTSPSYGSAGQILTSGGTGAAATWATNSSATADQAYFLSFMMG